MQAGPGAEIALCGAQAAGKSTFLAAGIPRLRRMLARELDLIIEPVDEEVRRRLALDLAGLSGESPDEPDPAWNNPDEAVLPPPTRTIRVDRQVLDPYLFRVARAGRAEVRFLAIYDMAGEDWEMAPAGFKGSGFAVAGGFLLFVDPLAFGGLAADPRVRGRFARPAARSRAEKPGAERLALLLGKSPIPAPVAIVLGKLDCWIDTLEPGLELVQAARAPRDAGRDPALDQAIHEEILALLDRWDCGDFLRAVEHHAPDHRFFAVSALGEAGHTGGGLGLSMPIMVERPLRWLLERQRFVPATRA
jgi:hypothetical protein